LNAEGKRSFRLAVAVTCFVLAALSALVALPLALWLFAGPDTVDAGRALMSGAALSAVLAIGLAATGVILVKKRL
jgi:hypothetical protein